MKDLKKSAESSFMVFRISSYLSAGIASDEIKATVYYLLGRANIVVGDMEAAVRNLRELTSSSRKANYPMAAGLLASALLSLDFDKYQVEAAEIASEGITAANTSDVDPIIQSNARIICWDCLATIERKRGYAPEAIKILDKAASEESTTYKATLSLRLLELLPEGQRREELIDKLADSVIELGSTSAEQRLDNSFRQVALPALIVLRLENRQHEFEKLLEFLEQSGECNSAERYKTFDALYALGAQQAPDGAMVFLRDIVAKFSENAAAQESVFEAITILIIRNREYSYADRYVDMIATRDPGLPLNDSDYVAVGYITSHFLRQDNIKQIESLDRLPLQLRTASAQNRFGYSFACYFEMLRQERLGRIENATNNAKELIELLSGSQEESGGLTPEVQSTMEEQAKSLLRRYAPKVRAANPYKGIGRNTIVRVRYTDGREIASKFKLVQRDLVLGSCELILERADTTE
jgi:tetratricopeptide (TPR) repeat protein